MKRRLQLSVATTLFEPGGVDTFWRYVFEESGHIFDFNILHQEACEHFPFSLPPTSYAPVIAWFQFFRSFKLALRFFLRHQPDVVAFNGTIAELHLTVPLFVARLLRLDWKPRIIRIFHSSELYKPKTKNVMNRFLLRLVGKMYGENFFVSRSVMEYWNLAGKPLQRFFSRKASLRPERARPLRVGYFGRVAYEKGPDRFCEVIEEVLKHRPLQPVVIGRGAWLESMKVRIPYAEFKGWVSNPQEILCELDLVLITSRSEGFGLGFGECLEMATPVIGYNIGGVSELLRSVANFALVPDGDQEGLANKIIFWVDQYSDLYQQYFKVYEANRDHSQDLVEVLLHCPALTLSLQQLNDARSVGV